MNESPARKPFLTAEWRKLVIANYAVDPEILQTYLPYRTELDCWQDKCYVSLVGFRFLKTKVRGMSIPFHTDFEEINLRFYVRYKADGHWKRGVTFIKEIVRKPALTFVANRLYNEKYVTHPTQYQWLDDGESLKVSYAWKHGMKWDKIHIHADAKALPILAGSEEEFITDHFWGYTHRGLKATSEYQVSHPQWLTYPVRSFDISVRFGDLYGKAFTHLSDIAPDSIMLAEGSEIAVHAAKYLTHPPTPSLTREGEQEE